MKCPVCQTEGLRSFVYPGMSSGTLMNIHLYYDEDGNEVVEDPNTYTTQYKCSEGHSFREERRREKTVIVVEKESAA